MRTYGQLSVAFWTDEKIVPLPDAAKLLAAYIITGPHANGIGCYRLPLGYISADLRWPEETVSETVSRLLSIGFLRRCPETDWVWLPNFLKYNPIANPNVGKFLMPLVDAVPHNVPFYKDFLGSLEPFSHRFPGEYVERLRERYRERYAKQGTGTGTRTGTNSDLRSGDGPSPPPLQASPPPIAPAPPPQVAQTKPEFDALKDQFWAWKPKLVQLLQKPPNAVGSLMGKWAKVGMGNAMEVFDRASRENPADPVSWIEAALRARAGQRAGTGPPAAAVQSRKPAGGRVLRPEDPDEDIEPI